METIIWSLMSLLSVLGLILALYFYLIHDDYQRGKLQSFEVQYTLNRYVPVEMVFQFIITIVVTIWKDQVLMILNFPMLLLNLFIIQQNYRGNKSVGNNILGGLKSSQSEGILITSQYECSEKNQKILKYRAAFYFTLTLSLLVRFGYAFFRMAKYHIDNYIQLQQNSIS